MTRSCGGCSVCCVQAKVVELNKPRGVACPHQCPTGCAIYQIGRPQACEVYSCAWHSGHGDQWSRPDVSGVFGEVLQWPIPGRLFVVGLLEVTDERLWRAAVATDCDPCRALLESTDSGAIPLDVVILVVGHGEILIYSRNDKDVLVARAFLSMLASGKGGIIHADGQVERVVL